MQPKLYTLHVTEQVLQIIAAGLDELPGSVRKPVLKIIQEQLNAQLLAEQAKDKVVDPPVLAPALEEPV